MSAMTNSHRNDFAARLAGFLPAAPKTFNVRSERELNRHTSAIFHPAPYDPGKFPLQTIRR